MPIRNPFARRAAADEAGPPDVAGHSSTPGNATDDPAAKQPLAFERVDTVGSRMSSSRSVHSRKSQDTGEYKMSVVNDSGVYLPPSPTERDANAFWPMAAGLASGAHARRFRPKAGLAPTSSASGGVPGAAGDETGRRSFGGDAAEPFVISRESFDSYRRSFDVSARSPVLVAAVAPGLAGRQSLDSAVWSRGTYQAQASRSSFQQQRQQQLFPAADEDFEDVGLDEQQEQPPQPPPHLASAFLRKRDAFFSKFGNNDHADGDAAAATASPASAESSSQSAFAPVSRFLLPGRKRAPSGAELKPLGTPT